MNNNQFKKFIRDKIEDYCREENLVPIYIDTTSNNRIYYIYNWDYEIQATLDNWIGNNDCRIRISYNKEKSVNIANKDLEFSGTYMELDQIIKSLKNSIKNIRKENGNNI